MLIWISTALLIFSHALYLAPLATRRSPSPSPVHFVGISALVYFDFGMLFEACGFRYTSDFFSPLFAAPQRHIILAVSLMAFAPWLIRIGARLTPAGPADPFSHLELRQGWPRLAFYAVLAILCPACAAIPLSLLTLGPRMWESRFLLGEMLGPWIIVLSFPMYLLGFYIRLREARTRAGKFTIAVLLASSTLATIAVGERTLVLLPFLIVLLFGRKFSWRRWLTVTAIGALAASLMLPLFKYSYQDGSDSPTQMLADTIMNDFYRAPELARTLGMASAFGTQDTAYAGSGYLYAALYFVPRTLAPFKGDSTAQQFTAIVMQREPGGLSWGFGISAVSEAVLNFGIVFAPLVLLAYGASLGWLCRKSARYRSLEIPLCLASLWLFGYHLAALMLNFGAMAIIGLICERVFTNRVGTALALTSGRGQNELPKGAIL